MIFTDREAINGTSDTCSTTSKQSGDLSLTLSEEIRKRQELEKEFELQVCLSVHLRQYYRVFILDI